MEQRIGPYQLVNRIGRGGMGTVHLALDPNGRQVAIKVINAELADEPTFRERFRREVLAAQRVRRFCTASVLDANLDNDPLYVVTEYVAGPNLDEHIRETGPMHGSSLEHLAVGVATALTAIQGAGIVHRDLKPANVLLSPVGPRVIDFGIARALDNVVAATRTGAFVGTPAYMAPEVIQGNDATPAADVWAWACVVAFAGTGNTPFSGNNVPAILMNVMQAEPNLTGLDPEVRKLVEAALAKDPEQRPSAQQLLDMLTGQTRADSEQTAQTVESNWPPVVAGSWTQQYGQAPAPAVAFQSPSSPTQQPGFPNLDQETRASSGPTHRPKGRKHLLIGAGAAVALTLGGGLLLALGGGDELPESTVLWSDSFQDDSTGWSGGAWNDATSNYGYRNGEYRMVTKQYSLSQELYSPYEGPKSDWILPDKVLVQSNVTAKGNPAGTVSLLCFGPDNEDGAYSFSLRVDGTSLSVGKAGKTGTPELKQVSDPEGFRPEKENKLQIACEKSGGQVRLRMWINGDQAVDVTDKEAPLNSVAVGIGVKQASWDGNGGVQADFDDFEVRQIK